MAKPYAVAFYKSKAWERCRAGYISSVHGLCEDCLARGIYKPGVIVHHIDPITPENIRDPKVTLNWDNLRLVCMDCHAEEHEYRGKNLRYKFGDNGEILPR